MDENEIQDMYDSMAKMYDRIVKKTRIHDEHQMLYTYRVYAIIGYCKDKTYYSILIDKDDTAEKLADTNEGIYLDRIMDTLDMQPQCFIRRIREKKMDYELYWPSLSYLIGWGNDISNLGDDYSYAVSLIDQYMADHHPEARKISIRRKK